MKNLRCCLGNKKLGYGYVHAFEFEELELVFYYRKYSGEMRVGYLSLIYHPILVSLTSGYQFL